MKNLKKAFALMLAVIMTAFVLAPCAVAAELIDDTLLYADRKITSSATYRLVGGVTESRIVFNNAAGSNQIKGSVMEVDMSNPDISIVAGYNDGDMDSLSTSTVREQAEAYEKAYDVNVVGAVNADCFFNTGDVYGLLVMNGKICHAAYAEPFFAILNDGTAVIRPFDGRTDDVAQAVGGMQILVVDGQIVTVNENKLHPRAAVGIKADGDVVFFIADGRQQPESCGMDYGELAQTMIALGCVDAMALDGGGSATMLTQREASEELQVANSPCYGFEREVGSSLLICSSAEPTGVFDHVAFSADSVFCAPNSYYKLTFTGVDENGFEAPLPENGYYEVADSSLGRYNGSTFYANSKTGTTAINYIVDGEIISSVPVEVSKEADDLLTTIMKEIQQMFYNFRNLLEFLFEKIRMA